MKKNRNWINQHRRDPFVREANAAGYRSRAAYKLLEIHRRDRLFRHTDTVLDLGAAPGGWSQVASQQVGAGGRVIAVDILPMEPLPGVVALQEDIHDLMIQDKIKEALAGNMVSVVISDMAPNITGVNALDQPRAIGMAELALEVGCGVLVPGGDFLTKVFQGEGFETFLKMIRAHFSKAMIRKPEASRSGSREVYVLGRGFRDSEQQRS